MESGAFCFCFNGSLALADDRSGKLVQKISLHPVEDGDSLRIMVENYD